jgi:hypothetical protein
MKRLLLVVFLLALSSMAVDGQTCDDTLMKHVYHPDRLVTKKGCITVTGKITKKIIEKDGDIHIRLKLNPGQEADLINAKNKSAQGGALVFEPVCVKKVVQLDAQQANC